MLPFLQPKKLAGIIMANTKKDGTIDDKGLEDDINHAMMSAAEDLLSGIALKDAGKVAKALESAYHVADSDDSSADISDEAFDSPSSDE